MSLAAIFLNKVPTLGGNGFAPIIFDAIISETQHVSAKMSQYPLESGAIASDHSIQNPNVLSVTVGVSDNPFKVLTASSSVAASTAGAALMGAAAGAVVAKFSGTALTLLGLGMGATLSSSSSTRSTTVKNALHYLKVSGALINFVGTRETYKNVVVIGVRSVLDKESELGATFQIDLAQPMIMSNTGTGSVITTLGDGTESTQGQSSVNAGTVVPS
ncbi:phage baseplate protein [Pseudomonas sp. LP_7_YM]|uniref:phage baseplate protein n=1 Tax=Pseudomonas sp. LP_7_YM TaxID=2485137 RepID=UPI00105F1BF1|nr:hypothetical protein [Pseudomonas sp. LP_7_YM]TDV61246.1 hypothetical protein EC915_10933 [Pseudomonas sp. LP_7_YM]